MATLISVSLLQRNGINVNSDGSATSVNIEVDSGRLNGGPRSVTGDPNKSFIAYDEQSEPDSLSKHEDWLIDEAPGALAARITAAITASIPVDVMRTSQDNTMDPGKMIDFNGAGSIKDNGGNLEVEFTTQIDFKIGPALPGAAQANGFYWDGQGLSGSQDAQDTIMASKKLVFVYDHAADGGAIGTTQLAAMLPNKAIPVRFWYRVLTTLTSATDAATVSLGYDTDGADALVAPIAISDVSNPWDAGNHEGIQDGAVANFGARTTAGRNLHITIAGEAVTAGKIAGWIEFVVVP